MSESAERMVSTPVSVVLRRRRGVTRWAPWIWEAVGVLPEAAPEPWRVLRQDQDGMDVQAAAPPLELHRTDAEAYRLGLAAVPPGLWVVTRRVETPEAGGGELAVRLVTASPYEAESYLQGGEDLVDRTPAPSVLADWVRTFVAAQPEPERFIKRQRGAKRREDERAPGEGAPKVWRAGDVYRAPNGRAADAGPESGDDDE